MSDQPSERGRDRSVAEPVSLDRDAVGPSPPCRHCGRVIIVGHDGWWIHYGTGIAECFPDAVGGQNQSSVHPGKVHEGVRGGPDLSRIERARDTEANRGVGWFLVVAVWLLVIMAALGVGASQIACEDSSSSGNCRPVGYTVGLWFLVALGIGVTVAVVVVNSRSSRRSRK